MQRAEDAAAPAPVYDRDAEARARAVLAGALESVRAGTAGLAEAVAAGEPVQLRRDIDARHNVPGRGRLTLAFEERLSNNGAAAGEYGTIRFDPAADGQRARNIDLVQIASLRTNRGGQEAHEMGLARGRGGSVASSSGGGSSVAAPARVEETNVDTGGTPAAKDLWRIGGAEDFHVDLTGDTLRPRTRSSDRPVESAYNAERRGSTGSGAWEDPQDVVSRGRDPGRVYLEPYPGQPRPRTDVVDERRIRQQPGYNRGGGDLREAELFDFPKSTDAGVFRFHTSVDADGEAWSTVEWGFTVLSDPRTSEPFVDSVDAPAFQDRASAEMERAQLQFDEVMANTRADTSPEALEWAESLDPRTASADERWSLGYIANVRADVIQRILAVMAARPGERERLLSYLRPHLASADAMLGILGAHRVPSVRLEAAVAAGIEALERR